MDDTRYARALAHAFLALVACTFGLIVLGALVRANDAGLACPDWPLCFGEFVPRMNLRVGFEWSHRLVAGSVSLAFVVLCILVLRRPSTRHASARLLAVGAVLLGIQVLLGALTVWQLLASWTVTAHLLVGNAFAVALLFTARGLYELSTGAPAPPRPSGPVRSGVTLVALLLGAQLVLGGLVASRYAGLVCPEWPTCNGGVWFPTFRGGVGIHLLHRLNGYALVVALGASAWLARSVPGLRRETRLALALGIAQVGVGIANVLLALPVEVTGLHSALACGLTLSVALAVRAAWRGGAGDVPAPNTGAT